AICVAAIRVRGIRWIRGIRPRQDECLGRLLTLFAPAVLHPEEDDLPQRVDRESIPHHVHGERGRHDERRRRREDDPREPTPKLHCGFSFIPLHLARSESGASSRYPTPQTVVILPPIAPSLRRMRETWLSRTRSVASRSGSRTFSSSHAR